MDYKQEPNKVTDTIFSLLRQYTHNASWLQLYMLHDYQSRNASPGIGNDINANPALIGFASSASWAQDNHHLARAKSITINLETHTISNSFKPSNTTNEHCNDIQVVSNASALNPSMEIIPTSSDSRWRGTNGGILPNQNLDINKGISLGDLVNTARDSFSYFQAASSIRAVSADLHDSNIGEQLRPSLVPTQIHEDQNESYIERLSLLDYFDNQAPAISQEGLRNNTDSLISFEIRTSESARFDEHRDIAQLGGISDFLLARADHWLPPGLAQEIASTVSNPITPLNRYYIYQSDIDNGTLILDKQGHYIVMEDLVFNPNPVGTQVFGVDASRLGLSDGDNLDSYRSGRPLASQFSYAGGAYDPKAYGIGFFAMISVLGTASGSILDLNGFTIEQSEEHALQQRFFSVIELAGAPFISGQGPHDFGPTGNNAVSNFEIRNGTIGRSAHHGVHGNGNQNIYIADVTFEDYEVAAVALNGVNGLYVSDVSASNSIDIPVNGAYSNARFISPYVDYLASLERNPNSQHDVLSLNVNGVSLSASQIQKELQDSLNSTFSDIIESGDGQIDLIDSNYYLFNNPSRLIDGNSYGFLVGPVGVQVNGFPDPPPGGFETPAENVYFADVEIKRQHSDVTEVAVLSNNIDGGMSNPVIDPIGASFMLRNNMNGIYNTLETADSSALSAGASDQDVLEANYKPNVLANAQLLVAKNKHAFANSPLDVSRMTIGDDIVAWAESDAPLSELRATLNQQDGWIYNTDNMVHVQKGTIGFKIDGVTGATLVDVSVENLHAQGGLGFDGNYEKGFVLDTATGYNGADAYGFTFSGSTDVIVTNAKVDNVSSQYGQAFGFASPLNNTTDISIIDPSITNLSGSGLDALGPNPIGVSSDFLYV